jgi:hypothetical protein
MHQQLWGYKVEEKLYVGVREQKRLDTTGIMFIDIFRGKETYRYTMPSELRSQV